eukprot:CAMPEP_0201925406 /NCGR_PEP_ID=MMETSP0903-20130614/14643_1 /ASSEMBLY_ACC=CAM_ASM_000552 /TAXON_ID=420261 /ORGANISM="Thalassiosira antarctica, Strain CCMP982" /LENGTH=234 /DNA_ID=CAMNT_0048463079 /DNA_START=36 /DNA_END=740 /DNA_ORIENTATION=+
MMKLTILAAVAGSAAAFSPSASIGASSTALRMSEPDTEVEQSPFVPDSFVLNGWSADAALPMHGLPGAVAPLGFFDPLGFSKGADLSKAKRLREAEVMHGRVSMMAVVGYLIGENTPTITYGFDFPHTIANNQLPEVPVAVLLPFFLAINFAEALRASVGWVEPVGGKLFTLRELYYPGDLGFDPLELKPKDAAEYAKMQTKELNNGRLAMLAAAGFCAQEQVNGQGILESLGF